MSFRRVCRAVVRELDRYSTMQLCRRMRNFFCSAAWIVLMTIPKLSPGLPVAETPTTPTMKLVEVHKIWDAGRHNAFTDLVQFRGKLLCAFREAGAHVPANHTQDGTIRVIESADGTTWTSAALLTQTGIDLRDPKLSITPDGRLMLLAAGSTYENRRLQKRECYVAFSPDGHEFSPLKQVMIDPQIRDNTAWLWRVTWHDKTAYGVVYSAADSGYRIHLVRSSDGVTYSLLKSFGLDGGPNECSVAFLPGGDMVMVARRDAGDKVGMIGRAAPPFRDWTWNKMNVRIGGPAIRVTPDGTLLLGTREYGSTTKTVLGVQSLDGIFTNILTFPSGGDTSYPGLVLTGNTLWMSYYSSHEGKTSIYLAKVGFNQEHQ